jgi:hypothetical protein
MIVSKIKRADAKPFFDKNHYAKGLQACALCFAFMDESEIMAVAAFACPISERVRASVFGPELSHTVIELHRLAVSPAFRERGFILSKFVSLAISELVKYGSKIGKRYNAVISFADSTENHNGGIYRASNFGYYGEVKRRSLFYMDSEGTLRHPRQNGKNIKIDEAINRGWKVVDKIGILHKYIYLTNKGVADKVKLKKKTFFKESKTEIEFKPQDLSNAKQLLLFGKQEG